MRWLRLFLALLVIPLAGCAINPGPATYQVPTKGPYTLDTGDVIRVSVYGDKDLSASYKVDDSGAIAFPLVGPLAVRGKTTEAAGQTIARALANGFMRSPNVTVEVDQYRPFYIQGEVKSSGQFPYVYGMTVRAAIATAGGFTDIADEGHVLIYRRQGDHMGRASVALDYPVQPGDTIVVQERWL